MYNIPPYEDNYPGDTGKLTGKQGIVLAESSKNVYLNEKSIILYMQSLL
jgi:hypothetical protein